MHQYYLLFALVAALIPWTTAEDKVIPEATWKAIVASAKVICACSNNNFTGSECVNRDQLQKMGTTWLYQRDQLCKFIKNEDKPTGSDSINGTNSSAPAGDSRNDTSTRVPAGDSRNDTSTPVPAGDSRNGTSTSVPAGDSRNGTSTSVPAGDSRNGTSTPVPAGDSRNDTSTPVPAGDSRNGTSTPVPAGDSRNGTSTPAPAGGNNGKVSGASPQTVNGSPEHVNKYSLGALLAILFCSFGAGILFAIGSKIAYDRYRKRSYVLPPEQGMQM